MRAGTREPQDLIDEQYRPLGRAGREETMMVDLDCPWCDARIQLEVGDMGNEVDCPECLTSTLLEQEESTIALAA